jgi:hypothetical protein
MIYRRKITETLQTKSVVQTVLIINENHVEWVLCQDFVNGFICLLSLLNSKLLSLHLLYMYALQLFVVVQVVRMKYKNLRTYFVKEAKKVSDSQRSGAGTDEIYNPVWPYYKAMEFMRETVGVTSSTVSSISLPATTAAVTEEPSTSIEVQISCFRFLYMNYQ